jgi:AcrR family transcriptional regulator
MIAAIRKARAPCEKSRRDVTATLARLLKVAVDEFAAKAYSGARIDGIASRAKVNVRMVYHDFVGKEALYIEVLEHTLSQRYVTLVSLAYFPKSNAHTLSHIFGTDLLNPEWQRNHNTQTHRMLVQFLAPPPSYGVTA